MKLELAVEDEFLGCAGYNEPPPELEDGVEEWEVEEILDAKYCYNSLWYWVLFKGYDPLHDKWVKHSDLFPPELIANFYCWYPAKPHLIAAANFRTILSHPMHRDAAFQGGGVV